MFSISTDIITSGSYIFLLDELYLAEDKAFKMSRKIFRSYRLATISCKFIRAKNVLLPNSLAPAFCRPAI